jgi:hypothetical protein
MCVKRQLAGTYTDGVEFETEQEAYDQVQWLDLRVYVDRHDVIRTTLAVAEPEWLSGTQVHPTKQRVPPYAGEYTLDTAALRSRIRGFAARMKQVPMTPQDLTSAVAAWIALWVRAGWPLTFITTACREHGGHRLAKVVMRQDWGQGGCSLTC